MNSSEIATTGSSLGTTKAKVRMAQGHLKRDFGDLTQKEAILAVTSHSS
jgi:hypothetical protein